MKRNHYQFSSNVLDNFNNRNYLTSEMDNNNVDFKNHNDVLEDINNDDNKFNNNVDNFKKLYRTKTPVHLLTSGCAKVGIPGFGLKIQKGMVNKKNYILYYIMY